MDNPNDDKKIKKPLIAEDPISKMMLETARKAAQSNAAILISGETGTGKELIARYVHDYSKVCHGSYVSINCAALPENMIESILFGYEKGAFTGAIHAYPGKFEQAHQGTLFLDEVAEIPLGLQAKLLRVLQESEVERLGGKKLFNVQVRVIAATNRDLKQDVKIGTFRSDLYYRLNVVQIHCESLRNRPLDIIPLTKFFIKKYSSQLQKNNFVLTDNAIKKLLAYTWPGNIRELENTIHRTLIMSNNDVINDVDVILNEDDAILTENENQFHSKLEENEAKMIIDVLNEVDGSRGIAAKKLKISPRTLRYKISKLKSIGIKVP